MRTRNFFKECKAWWWPGFYIPVRSSMSFHLKKKHLSPSEKELYENEFGEMIITDQEFDSWLSGLKKRKT